MYRKSGCHSMGQRKSERRSDGMNRTEKSSLEGATAAQTK